MAEHTITRQKHEARRRRLTVQAKHYLTPGMLRLVLDGEDLADFTSLGADDHVKLFIPMAGGLEERRDYTPRAFDRTAKTLTIDFAIHDAGPATRWAVEAAIGDVLEIGGPRGSMIVPTTFDWWLLVGDETALPAIGRRLEELPPGARAISVVAVTGPAEEQALVTLADHSAVWVHRPGDQDDAPDSLIGALDQIVLPPGDGFVWIAAEARVARALRAYMIEQRGHPPGWMKAAGYWRKGVADAHDKLD